MVFSFKKRRKRIGLFGGSFNPPHLGHREICKWLFNRGIVDEVWVIPCFMHPFGKKLAPFGDRMAMCKMAFNNLGLSIRILDIEQKLGGVSFTIRTIEHLKKEYPDFRFQLVTGEDVREDVNDWHESERIREEVETIHLPRGPKSPIPAISSTEIRDRIDAGIAYTDLVENEVAVYIITKGLYR